ncbi:SHOCT domain-containing protein [Thermoanaerobacter sp. CM-CNRG TB177]|uniref:SHOCT domain-containing protein n=1 Tax=Thermoanaerobacter TaxID=1754 RepID=UPI001BDE7E98|nr:SHOCT domain-containing protein [Thermoanaerobacter sp. CM-CNRG TB177]MBT1280371.1 SHOCT domain-containing protein [Thermoanaerobacter sp. CM-CNRG TB177]
MMRMMYGWGWGYGIGGFIWSIVWMAIEIGLIVAAIYLIVLLFRGTKNRNKEKDAIEILKERYARGEISEEEYLERKKRLEEK